MEIERGLLGLYAGLTSPLDADRNRADGMRPAKVNRTGKKSQENRG